MFCNEAVLFLNAKHKITSGFFVENTVIVAEGELQPDCTFKVFFPLFYLLSLLHYVVELVGLAS